MAGCLGVCERCGGGGEGGGIVDVGHGSVRYGYSVTRAVVVVGYGYDYGEVPLHGLQ